MRLGLLAALLVGFVGCSTPVPAFDLAIADGGGCGATDCADIHLTCASVVSIRILDPKNPKQPYISQCQDVQLDRPMDLCSLANIQLDKTPLPESTLEVEVVVFPASAVPRETTPGDAHDHPVCPANVTFESATGFPISPTPLVADDNTVETSIPAAIGGRAFYHRGDEQVVVNLGCPDLTAVDGPSCSGNVTIPVKATVIDFDTQQSVSSVLANRLGVSIGEPQVTSSTTSGGIEYILNPSDTAELARVVQGPVPAWGADVALMFQNAACLEVLDDVSGSTATLSCKKANPQDTAVNITGVHVPKETLDQIVNVLGNPSLAEGLTLGIVLENGSPPTPAHTSEISVTTSSPTATLRYLSADGLNFSSPSLTASGIFVSDDAPFGTQFTANNAQTTAFQLGGLVDNKITVVVLSLTRLPQ